MEQLSGLDAAFLLFETPTVHMHVLGLVILDPSTMPGGYSYDRIRSHIEERAPLMPGMRRKLAQVPFNLARPFWVDDKDFDLDYHLHRHHVRTPGGDRELADVVAEIGGRQLDRSHPLWELHVVEGMADGTIALVLKLHHSTVDGITGANMLFHLFDLSPTAEGREEVVDTWSPERKPSEVSLLGRGVAEAVTRPFGVAKILPGTAVRTIRLLVNRGQRGTGMPAPFRAPRTNFNATLTAHRIVAFGVVPMSDVKLVKNAFGVKVNDVVLAICAGALRRYLEERDELPERSLIAAIPVSVHADTSEREGTNKVSFMFNTLSTDIDDPVERLRNIAEANEGAKADHKMLGAATLQQWADHAAPNTFSMAARLYSSMRFADRHPVVHNLTISNVPGPELDLYCAGAKLKSLFPLGPVMDGSGLNITVLSQQSGLGFGMIGCRELIPDLWDLCDQVPAALAELVDAAKQQKTPAPTEVSASAGVES